VDVDVDEYWEVLEHSEGSRLPELKTDGRPKGSSFVPPCRGEPIAEG